MSRTVVVGAGLAGVVAGLLARRRGDEVLVLEQAQSCGGLLRSWRDEQGRAFDYGTHFGRDTGLPELDELLYGHLDPGSWHRFQVVRTGHYVDGRLDEQSLFLDARTLPEPEYRAGVEEFLGREPFSEEPTDLDAWCRGTYGHTFAGRILFPPLEKLFGCPARELAPEARHLFGLSRLRCFTPEETRELKRSPFFDEKLAFHSFHEGQSGKSNYYPHSGGIGRWMETLVDRLEAQGAAVRTGQRVERVEHAGGRVRTLVLADGTRVDCDEVVWTVPPALCLKAAGLAVPTRPPDMLSTALLHFVVDAPFLTSLYYFVCYDPDLASYRTTLYPNVGVDDPGPGPYHFTTEVVHRGDADLHALQARVPDELRAMGVLTPEARILSRHAHDLRNCIPVQTPQFLVDTRSLAERAEGTFSNVRFHGSATGRSFFMHDVLIDVYRDLAH